MYVCIACERSMSEFCNLCVYAGVQQMFRNDADRDRYSECLGMMLTMTVQRVSSIRLTCSESECMQRVYLSMMLMTCMCICR